MILKRNQTSEIPPIPKFKYLIPDELSVAQIISVIRKNIKSEDVSLSQFEIIFLNLAYKFYWKFGRWKVIYLSVRWNKVNLHNCWQKYQSYGFDDSWWTLSTLFWCRWISLRHLFRRKYFWCSKIKKILTKMTVIPFIQKWFKYIILLNSFSWNLFQVKGLFPSIKLTKNCWNDLIALIESPEQLTFQPCFRAFLKSSHLFWTQKNLMGFFWSGGNTTSGGWYLSK